MGGYCGSCSVVSGRLSMRNLAVVHLILGAGRHSNGPPFLLTVMGPVAPYGEPFDESVQSSACHTRFLLWLLPEAFPCACRNIFENRKYAEEYVMDHIESELGVDRTKLIHLALLLGSDYTEGVAGVGVVNALEIANHFTTEPLLEEFRCAFCCSQSA